MRIRIGPLHSDIVSAIIMVSIILMINVVITHLMSTNDTCSVNVYTYFRNTMGLSSTLE